MAGQKDLGGQIGRRIEIVGQHAILGGRFHFDLHPRGDLRAGAGHLVQDGGEDLLAGRLDDDARRALVAAGMPDLDILNLVIPAETHHQVENLGQRPVVQDMAGQERLKRLDFEVKQLTKKRFESSKLLQTIENKYNKQ